MIFAVFSFGGFCEYNCSSPSVDSDSIFVVTSSTDWITSSIDIGWIGFLLSTTLYFALGALIGWIYGRVKNRNKHS
jgi:hypothetical protein